MGKDLSGIPHSCPFIDSAIDAIVMAEKYLGALEDDEADNISYALCRIYHGRNSDLEKARAIHDELRSYASNLNDQLNQANSDAEYYETQYNEALNVIEDLKQQLKELQTNE